MRKVRNTCVPMASYWCHLKWSHWHDTSSSDREVHKIGFNYLVILGQHTKASVRDVYATNILSSTIQKIETSEEIHTQTIERFWHDLKEWIKQPGMKSNYMHQYLASTSISDKTTLVHQFFCTPFFRPRASYATTSRIWFCLLLVKKNPQKKK